MSEEKQLHETSSAASISAPASVFVPSQSKMFVFLCDILTFIYELLFAIATKVIHGAVIFGTVFHSRIIIPSTVFFAALYTILSALFTRFRDYLKIRAHSANVAISHFRSNRFALAVSLLAVTFIIIASTFYSTGIRIIADGEELGYMYSREEYDTALNLVEERASEILGRPYSVTVPVHFEIAIVPREKVISKDALRSYFFSRIEEVSALYALTVDGEVIGASRNKDVLQGIINELLHTDDPAVKAHFTQDVQIAQKYVDSSKLISYDEIREKLTSTIHSSKQYTIRSGDTLDSIAKENGMTRAELLELNPSLSSRNLRAGKKVTVAKEVPFLSVEAVKRVEYTETIPFETKQVEDANIYKGSTKVVTQGKVGKRKVVADVTYVDNKEVSRDIISSSVVSQPVTKVVHVGTKPRPKTVATGKLSRPVSGCKVSSNFGMRRGRMHKGVDFSGRIGTRISAADGGTVTWAGWKSGGWGYLVIINHGNGLETYYAHNSKITVKVGQKVAKGEEIAKMGSTGNSTGSHLHFEVHVNGRYINPWNYIK